MDSLLTIQYQSPDDFVCKYKKLKQIFNIIKPGFKCHYLRFLNTSYNYFCKLTTIR